MSEDQQALEWRLKLLSAAPSWQYSQQDIDKLRAENAELKSHNEYLQGDAGLADMVIERMKAENAELRKLVVDAWWSDRRFDSGSNNKRWEQWSSQHPILQHDS